MAICPPKSLTRSPGPRLERVTSSQPGADRVLFVSVLPGRGVWSTDRALQGQGRQLSANGWGRQKPTIQVSLSACFLPGRTTRVSEAGATTPTGTGLTRSSTLSRGVWKGKFTASRGLQHGSTN